MCDFTHITLVWIFGFFAKSLCIQLNAHTFWQINMCSHRPFQYYVRKTQILSNERKRQKKKIEERRWDDWIERGERRSCSLTTCAQIFHVWTWIPPCGTGALDLSRVCHRTAMYARKNYKYVVRMSKTLDFSHILNEKLLFIAHFSQRFSFRFPMFQSFAFYVNNFFKKK